MLAIATEYTSSCPFDANRSSQVALTENAYLIIRKCTNNRMKDSAVVEEDKITLFPIMGVDVLWCNGWSLEFVYSVPNFLKIINYCTIGKVNFANRRGVYLQRKLSGRRVFPYHRQNLDFFLLDRGELIL